MEAEAAGVIWPQLNLKASNTQAEPESDSGAEEANISRAQISTPGDDASRKIIRAEKRKRKAERAARRAAKEARRQSRASAASSSLLIETQEDEKEEEPLEDDILVPQSSAPAGFSLSFPEVSTSPVEDDEKEDDVQSAQEDGATLSQPVSSVETNPPTNTQPWTAPQISLSPSATPTISPSIPQNDLTNLTKKNKGKGKESQPASTVETNPSTNTQPWTAPQISLSPSATPTPSVTPTPSPAAPQTDLTKKNKGKGKARQPLPTASNAVDSDSDQDTLDASQVESSIPEQADLGKVYKAVASSSKSRPNGNAEAGPSKPKIKKSKTKNQLPTPAITPPSSPEPLARKPIKQKKPRGSGASEGRTVEKDDIEHLRRTLATPAAAHEYIASSYWPPPHLKKLEEAGIITLVSGKMSSTELNAVKRHLEIFMRTNRLDEEQLVEVIMAKSKGGGHNARESYPTFWQDIAMQVPGRPLRYVVKQIQRIYDPRARQGKWTEKEDAALKRAYEIHPGMWTKIASIIERTEQDCRDRYNKEIANNEHRNIGNWSSHEEVLLRDAVLEANRAMGNPGLSIEAPWEVISAKMGHLRGPSQCRTKWHRDLYPRENGTPSTLSRAPNVKPQKPLTLAAKRAGITPSPNTKKRKSPIVLLNGRRKKKPTEYKSQDVISNSGSEDEEEDRAEKGSEDGKLDEDD